jgi:ribonucleotide reductase alpha subunit
MNRGSSKSRKAVRFDRPKATGPSGVPTGELRALLEPRRSFDRGSETVYKALERASTSPSVDSDQKIEFRDSSKEDLLVEGDFAKARTVQMKVIKRNGRSEPVSFDKVLKRIEVLCRAPFSPYEKKIWCKPHVHVVDDFVLIKGSLLEHVEPVRVAQKVCSQIKDGISTVELDDLAADVSAHMGLEHPEYFVLASRIEVSNLHKFTPNNFAEAVKNMEARLSPSFVRAVSEGGIAEELERAINYTKDYVFDYFGIKTLEKVYLLKGRDRKIGERPQHMIMRVAAWIYYDPESDELDVPAVPETYRLMSERYFTHASPTLFNAGTKTPQGASCFIENTQIFTTEGPKAIQAVKLGDMVVTHAGRVRPVVQLHKNPLGDRSILRLKVLGSPVIHLTDNHRVMTMPESSAAGKSDPVWTEAGQLKGGDYILVPKYEGGIKVPEPVDVANFVGGLLNENSDSGSTTARYDGTPSISTSCFASVSQQPVSARSSPTPFPSLPEDSRPICRYLEWTPHFYRLVGIWLGDGHLLEYRNGIWGIGFTMDTANTRVFDYIRDVGEKAFGLKATFHNMKNQSTTQINFHNMAIGLVFHALFGEGFAGKRLAPQINDWPTPLLQALVEGLIISDGCITSNGMVMIKMSNIPLMTSLYHLLRTRGVAVSLRETTASYRDRDGTIIPCKLVAALRIPRAFVDLANIPKMYTDGRMETLRSKVWRPSGHSLERDGRTYVRVVSVEPTDRSDEYVYNLGVEEDHSYMADGIFVANCFLVGKLGTRATDSIDDMYKAINHMANISRVAGGLGIHVHEVRAAKAYIDGTGGNSSGLIPLVKVMNEMVRHVNQAGVRKGALTIYLEPWHNDFLDFLELRKNSGPEEERARGIFTAVWNNDLFMKRVEEGKMWSLMCPNESEGLSNVYGDEFVRLYEKYEEEGRFKRQMPAREIYLKIMRSQIETRTPYMTNKDAVNQKSNQKNIGVIKSSNLCNEVNLVSTPNETAVCTLASISLVKFVKYSPGSHTGFCYDFQELHSVAKVVTKNLDRIIDVTFNPGEESARSNMRHRPVGLGV